MRTLIVILISILSACGGGSPDPNSEPPLPTQKEKICDMNNWGPQENCVIPAH